MVASGALHPLRTLQLNYSIIFIQLVRAYLTQINFYRECIWRDSAAQINVTWSTICILACGWGGGNCEKIAACFCNAMYRPAQNASEQRSVETFGWRETPLNLGDGHFVLGRRAEKRESTGHRAEQIGLCYRSASHWPVLVLLFHAHCTQSVKLCCGSSSSLNIFIFIRRKCCIAWSEK